MSPLQRILETETGVGIEMIETGVGTKIGPGIGTIADESVNDLHASLLDIGDDARTLVILHRLDPAHIPDRVLVLARVALHLFGVGMGGVARMEIVFLARMI
jgi:hypothetical protein